VARTKQFIKLKENVPAVHVLHPLRNEKNERKLVEYVLDRLTDNKQFHDALTTRYAVIDLEMAGFLKSDVTDIETLELDRHAGGKKRIKEINPQLVAAQIGRGITYILSILFPDTGLYEAIATKDKQEVANAFVALMNEHAEKSGSFRHLVVFLINAFKYNLGCINVEWYKEFGNVISDQGGTVQVEPDKILWEGNKQTVVDMYNLYWDSHVHPCEVHKDGEFVAEVFMESLFAIRKAVDNQQIFGVNRWINDDTSMNAEGKTFFSRHPQIRKSEYNRDVNSDGTINWDVLLSPLTGRVGATGMNVGYEKISCYIRLYPKDFGLVSNRVKGRDTLEIWRVDIYQGKYVGNAEFINNAHGYLPYLFSMPNEDNLILQTRSVAEVLIPLQHFGSFLLSTHMEATIKNIWELIVYDSNIVDLSKVGNDVAARVPLKPNALGARDLDKVMKRFESKVDTRQSMTDFNMIIELMEFFLPTQALKQVADLQRATQHQSAATVQAAHRDLWKYAKIIDTQAMGPSRRIQHSNVLQYQQAISIPNPQYNPQPGGDPNDPANKALIEIQPTMFRNAGLEFTIGEGLKGLDKMSVVQLYKDLTNSVLQSREAINEFDVVKMINHLSTLMGDKTDLTQFRRPPAEMQARAEMQAQTAGKE